MTTRRRRRLVVAVVLAAIVALGAAAAAGAFSSPTPAQIAAARAAARVAAEARAAARLLREETSDVRVAERSVNARLPSRVGAPAPATPATLFRSASTAHQVIGYVPYWLLAKITPADLADTTTVAYYGLDLDADGSLDATGPGRADFDGPGFANLVSAAHQAHDRVLLTVSSEEPSTIAALLKDPSVTSARVVDAVVPLLAADGLDGVAIDIEGRSARLRGRFVEFVDDLTARLSVLDPHAEVVLDAYPQSAGSSSDFFDVSALSRDVSDVFVMAYDMESAQVASAGAPLASPSLGLSDVQSLIAYVRAVPAQKLILGAPLYGVGFTTADAEPGSPTTSDTPSTPTDASIAALGRFAKWDPGSLTPYATWRTGSVVHQLWYEDPVSLALKTALAEEFHLAGTGAWALGDEGEDQALLEALDGGVAPLKQPLLAGPSKAAVAAAEAGS